MKVTVKTMDAGSREFELTDEVSWCAQKVDVFSATILEGRFVHIYLKPVEFSFTKLIGILRKLNVFDL